MLALPSEQRLMLGMPGWLTAPLPGKPNQNGLEDEYALEGMANQSGKFINLGTTLPAAVGDVYDFVTSLPNQAGQWWDNLKITPNLCAISAVVCTATVIASVSGENR